MKSRLGCVLFTVTLMIFSALIVLGLLGMWLWNRSREQEQARVTYAQPVVLINEPLNGASLPVGSFFMLTADIFDTPDAPLMRVEIWLDGELQEEKQAEMQSSLSPYVYTHLLMPSEGAHILSVRAVNSLGIIGQSKPLVVIGSANLQDVALLVPLPEDGDLAGLADAYGMDEATLEALNPGLAGQQPAPGAIIAVPKPAENEPPPQQPAPLPPADFQAINPATLPLDPAGLPGWGLKILQLNPPAAPSGLQAQVKDCKVKLVWNDNASDEGGYNIWIHGANFPAHIFAVLKPSKGGQTWFEFTSPAGGSLGFWVEAFNIIGAQPSQIVWTTVDPKCSSTLPTHIQIELLDINMPAACSKSYCYVSFEGAPETRLPEHDGTFISVQGGQGNLSGIPYIFSIPIPADQSVEVTGECWGWAGSTLLKLGKFSHKFPMQTWNGVRQELDGGAIKLGMAVSQFGAVKPGGAPLYDKFPDPLIPPPYNVQEGGTRCPGVSCSGVVLFWEWQPSAAFKGQITGFDIYLDGKLYKTVSDPYALSSPVVPPAGCGKPVRWQVAAVAGTTRSMLSLPFEYNLPACKAYAVVKFETLEIPWTGDGLSDGPCDELEIYYDLSLSSNGGWSYKEFGYGGEAATPTIFSNIGTGFILGLKPIKCTKNAPPYTFAELGSWFEVPYPDTLIVPIPVTKIHIEVATYFSDYDDYSTNDAFGYHIMEHNYPDLQMAVKKLGCGKTFRDPPDDYKIHDTADTAVSYTLTVYPNPCGDVPQGIPLP